MRLINCKFKLSLKCIENGVLTTADNATNATLKKPDAKFQICFVTLSTGDNAKLAKQLS